MGGAWRLLGANTNERGVTHFTVTRASEDDGDLDELLRVLRDRFGAAGDGELLGPYSLTRYVKVGGLRLGIEIDSPGWLGLYTTEATQTDALASLVPTLLEAMNSEAESKPTG